jgi:hypothetical protein
MPVGVLEVLLVLGRHHGAFAQHHPAVAAADGQVAALAVVGRSLADLGHVGDRLARHPCRDRRVAGGPEVVRVREEGVAETLVPQGLEHPARRERDVDVTVAGRAPLEVGVVGPRHRREVVGAQLGLGVLEEVQRQALHREVVVGRQHLERLLPGAERVHQHQRHVHAVLLAQGEHLASHDVEEGQPVAHLQDGLRPGQAHARAESAVQLDDRGVRQRPRLLLGVALEILEARHVGQRLDVGLRDEPGVPGLELGVRVLEDAHRQAVHAALRHALHRLRQPVLAHEPQPSGTIWACPRPPRQL